MLHDDDYLYVHAQLEEPHVWGSIHTRNAVIFNDPDFEIFIDPDGDNHDYYEFEVNALGTTWQLSLPSPYRTGAQPRDPDELDGLRVAVAVDGPINDPTTENDGWSVEVALPLAALQRFAPSIHFPPREGDVWRVNLSRVQWPYVVEGGRYRKADGARENNWVWSPQGVVDMHRPSTWGCVRFARVAGGVPGPAAPDQAMRNLLMGVWERMRRCDEPTDDAAALGVPGDRVRIERAEHGWRAVAEHEGRTWFVDESARFGSETGTLRA